MTHVDHVGRRAAAVFAALTGFTTSTGAQNAARSGSPVAVHLHRRTVVGQRTRVDATGERHSLMEVNVPGRPDVRRHDDRRAHLVAIERTLAVDDHGSATRSEYVIARFEEDGPNPSLVMHQGQLLVIERSDTSEHSTATLDGQALTRPQMRDLGLVLDMTVSPITEDEIAGTTQPQPVGARWPVNGEMAARDIASTGVTATMTGHSQLLARRREHRVDALEVATDITGTVTAVHDLPPDATIRTGTLHVTFHGLVPVSPTAIARSDDTRAESDLAWTFHSEGAPLQGHLRSDERRHEVFAPP
jgi:hypothetical protein